MNNRYSEYQQKCLIWISISKYVKKISLKHSSFCNEKAPQSKIWPEQTLQEHNFILGIQQMVYLRARKCSSIFSRGANNYNEIESSLSSREVLNSKNTQNLSQWCANRFTNGFLIMYMYILHFKRLNSYMYGNTQQKLKKSSKNTTYEGRSICNENSPVYPKVLYLHTS